VPAREVLTKPVSLSDGKTASLRSVIFFENMSEGGDKSREMSKNPDRKWFKRTNSSVMPDWMRQDFR